MPEGWAANGKYVEGKNFKITNLKHFRRTSLSRNYLKSAVGCAVS